MLPGFVKAPGIQLRGQLPLLHCHIAAAVHLRAGILGAILGYLGKPGLRHIGLGELGVPGAADSLLPGIHHGTGGDPGPIPGILRGRHRAVRGNFCAVRYQENVADIYGLFSGSDLRGVGLVPGFNFLVSGFQVVAQLGKIHIGPVGKLGGIQKIPLGAAQGGGHGRKGVVALFLGKGFQGVRQAVQIFLVEPVGAEAVAPGVQVLGGGHTGHQFLPLGKIRLVFRLGGGALVLTQLHQGLVAVPGVQGLL